MADSTPSRAAVAVACTNCRSRHLKCDGKQPCGRCVQEGLAECSYVKSRRGWKGPRKTDSTPYSRSNSSAASGFGASSTLFSTMSPTLDQSILDSNTLTTETLTSPSGAFPLELLVPVESHGQIVLLPPPPPNLPIDATLQGLINAFYIYFYPGHPFVMPGAWMAEMVRRINLAHLQVALQYLGSFYVAGADHSVFESSLRRVIASYSGNKDHFFVQTLLLFAIGLHMADKEEESTQAMYAAINLAREIKMNEPIYAQSHGGVNTVLEECIRRTWWELWVLDGMMCGVNHTYTMQLGQVDVSQIPLPNEESAYFQGKTCNVIRTLDHYDESFLNDEDEIYSSSTYRIDAIRILHKVVAASRGPNAGFERFELAETHIKNWTFFLPEAKKRPLSLDGAVDEVLFEAHMIISACIIMLNQPRSDLSTDEVQNVTTCVGRTALTLPSQYKEYHTANAMNAAMNICMLIKLPCPLIKHSPFFTCAITMASVVYLAYWSFIVTEDRDRLIKEHIRLNLGSLKVMGGAMPIARTVMSQVRGVAREIFHHKRAIRNAYYNAVTREQIIEGLIDEVSTSMSPTVTVGSSMSPISSMSGSVPSVSPLSHPLQVVSSVPSSTITTAPTLATMTATVAAAGIVERQRQKEFQMQQSHSNSRVQRQLSNDEHVPMTFFPNIPQPPPQ